MYVLTRLVKRCETTDTMLICGSNNFEDLQDLILSTYEDSLYEVFNEILAESNYSIEDAMIEATDIVNNFIDTYNITKIPMLSGQNK